MTVIDRVREYMRTAPGEVRVGRLREVIEASQNTIYVAAARLVDAGEIIRIRNGVFRSKATYGKIAAEEGAPASAPEIVPVAPVPAPVPAAAPVEPELFHACLYLDGDLDLRGLIELDDGGYRIQADNVERLRALIGAPGSRGVA